MIWRVLPFRGESRALLLALLQNSLFLKFSLFSLFYHIEVASFSDLKLILCGTLDNWMKHVSNYGNLEILKLFMNPVMFLQHFQKYYKWFSGNMCYHIHYLLFNLLYIWCHIDICRGKPQQHKNETGYMNLLKEFLQSILNVHSRILPFIVNVFVSNPYSL